MTTIAGIRFKKEGACWVAPLGTLYEIVVSPVLPSCYELGCKICSVCEIWQAAVSNVETGNVLHHMGAEFVAVAITKMTAVRFILEIAYHLDEQLKPLSLSDEYAWRIRFNQEGNGIPARSIMSQNVPFNPEIIPVLRVAALLLREAIVG